MPAGPTPGEESSRPVRPIAWHKAAMADPEITRTDVIALGAFLDFAPGQPRKLGSFAGQAGEWDFFASRDALAEKMRSSTNTVDRSTQRLRALGYLHLVAQGRRHGTRGEASVWRLCVPGTDS